jgi:DNA-binding response OmpR family regulator
MNVKKLLLLDDQIDSLSDTYSTLIRQGFDVEASSDVFELDDRIRRFKPDLLITDAGLIQKYVWLDQRIRSSGIPFLLLTDRKKPAIPETDNILYKPYLTRQLVGKIRSVLQLSGNK